MSQQKIPPYPPPHPLPSYWLKNIGLPTSPLPAKVDIAIIGGGISGTSVAYHLRRLRPDWRIALLECRDISGGATGRNGGLMIPGVHDTWTTTVDHIGLDNARRLLRFDANNCAAIHEFLSSHPGDDDTGDTPPAHLHQFTTGCVNAFETPEEMALWTREFEKMREAGCADGLELWDRDTVREKLGTERYVGALCSRPAYRLWPARLVLRLAKAALQEGKGSVSVHTHTLVTEVERRDADAGSGFTLTTSRGTLHARKVIYCTNAHTRTLLPHLPIVPIRNQVIVTTPIHPIPFDACVSANDGYEYLSTREDGRIVLGGLRYLAPDMDVGNGDDAHLDPNVSAALHTYLESRFPHLRGRVKVEMEWAGIMAFTEDRFPFVGPVGPDAFVSAGFCGHGMPRAFLCGKHVAEMVAGVPVGEEFPRLFMPEGRCEKQGKQPVESVPLDRFRSKI
ncbi:hypothetical protein HK104_011481 [Borealophlyctis nickersoniae]|nr:hypothetical protein HK104_011481 [Borealophlyctis nickersoniae]